MEAALATPLENETRWKRDRQPSVVMLIRTAPVLTSGEASHTSLGPALLVVTSTTAIREVPATESTGVTAGATAGEARPRCLGDSITILTREIALESVCLTLLEREWQS